MGFVDLCVSCVCSCCCCCCCCFCCQLFLLLLSLLLFLCWLLSLLSLCCLVLLVLMSVVFLFLRLRFAVVVAGIADAHKGRLLESFLCRFVSCSGVCFSMAAAVGVAVAVVC